MPHAQSCAAARVAVELGQDDAGQGQRVFESFGGVDRILTLHGVDNKQGLDRVEHGVQLFNLGHQGFVDGQAAGGVDQQHIKIVAFGVVKSGACNVDGFLLRCAGKPFSASLGGDSFELLNGGGAVNVARDGQHFFLALFNQVLGQFGGGGGFACALQASHQNHGGGLGCEVDVAHTFAHGGGELFADDADQHLAGLQ